MKTKPYEPTLTSDVLTTEVISSLLLVFQQSKLSIREIHVKLPGQAWEPFPLSETDMVSEQPFCNYVRNTAPFSKYCTADRESCRDRLISTPSKDVVWYCPFGLRILGMGFKVGLAEVVLRTNSWLETGNESKVTNLVLEIAESEKVSSARRNLLDLLPHQFSWSDTEVRKDARSLAALVN